MADRYGSWILRPGDRIERTILQDRYGGRTQGGIGPSRKTPNVLIFSDPATGARHGYFDDWGDDGCYHYTGEGQFGDQRMVSGNASILNHVEEGRALRLFEGARGTVTYIDEFELDRAEPWYETDAPESEAAGRERKIRKVIVFRLRPTTTQPGRPRSVLTEVSFQPEKVQRVNLEDHRTEKTYVNPSGEPYEAERREAAMLEEFTRYLRGQLGHKVYRHQILPPGERKPLFTDLYDETENVVFEAKGTVTREAVRMAIGQLADYVRFLPKPRTAILVPSEPRKDLIALAWSQDISFIWLRDGVYMSSQVLRPAAQL